MIREGKVRVNNKVVTQMGVQIDPARDEVTAGGRRLRPNEARTYLLLYKPAGVVTTCRDPQRRKTVLDLLPGKERLFPVGRLDYETEGLLLLTDDGELANRLLHPRYKIPKTYFVETDGLLTEEMAARLEKGLKLEDGLTQPARLKMVYCSHKGSRFYLTITEGRNRQVRRMCRAVGLRVVYLRRTKIGFLSLNGLAPGEYRSLTPQEIKQLRILAE
jgi:pseudouridine synthase